MSQGTRTRRWGAPRPRFTRDTATVPSVYVPSGLGLIQKCHIFHTPHSLYEPRIVTRSAPLPALGALIFRVAPGPLQFVRPLLEVPHQAGIVVLLLLQGLGLLLLPLL